MENGEAHTQQTQSLDLYSLLGRLLRLLNVEQESFSASRWGWGIHDCTVTSSTLHGHEWEVYADCRSSTVLRDPGEKRTVDFCPKLTRISGKVRSDQDYSRR